MILNSDYECTQCPPLWQTIFGIVAGILAVIGFFVYTKKDNQKGFEERDVYIKICISSFQLNGLALTYGFDWGGMMNNYLEAQSQTTTLGTKKKLHP